MPRSQAAVQDTMLKLAQQFPQLFQSMNAGQIAQVLQVPDATAFAYVADPQIALAEWENGRMIAGADDIEVEIAEWHDHAKHKERHNALRASASYRDADPDTRAYIDKHIEAHDTLEHEQMQQQMQEQMQQQMAMAGGGAPPADGSSGAPGAGGAPSQPTDPMAAMAAMAGMGGGAALPQGGPTQ
jgi:hypothetical protein